MELRKDDLELRRKTAREGGVMLVATGTMQNINGSFEWVSRPRRHQQADVPQGTYEIVPSEEALLVPDIKLERLVRALQRCANSPVAEFPW